jgi:hypothetical protein
MKKALFLILLLSSCRDRPRAVVQYIGQESTCEGFSVNLRLDCVGSSKINGLSAVLLLSDYPDPSEQNSYGWPWGEPDYDFDDPSTRGMKIHTGGVSGEYAVTAQCWDLGAADDDEFMPVIVASETLRLWIRSQPEGSCDEPKRAD